MSANLELGAIELISFKRHRFPPEVISYGVWRFRFAVSFRDVEELAQRGIEVSYETIRRWTLKFAANLRRRRSPPTGRWRLDEVVVKIRGRPQRLPGRDHCQTKIFIVGVIPISVAPRWVRLRGVSHTSQRHVQMDQPSERLPM